MDAENIRNALIPETEEVRTFLIARARAIDMYATVEQSMASLFAYLMGVTPDYAGVPFFKITSARVVISILERLLKKRHGATYNVFWNSLSLNLQTLARQRNEIVHWNMAQKVFINAQHESRMESALIPPNYWDRTENTPELRLEDFHAFIWRAFFIYRLMNMFVEVISGRLAGLPNPEVQAVVPTWQEIFQQPITYPPPDTHPLYLKS